MLWSSFGIRMIMTLYKELKAFFYFYEIIWVVLILDPLWNFSIILQWIHLIFGIHLLGRLYFEGHFKLIAGYRKIMLLILSWFNVSIDDAPRNSTISLNLTNLMKYKFWGYVLMIFWIYCVCWNDFLFSQILLIWVCALLLVRICPFCSYF